MRATDRRGVSEALSFVLVFSIIIASVGFAYVGGYGALTDYQESEQVSNAERALIGLKGAFDDVERGNADARTGEMRLAGGTLSINESGSIAVEVDYGEENATWRENISTGSLAYDYSDATVAYESSAIVRQRGEGGIIREPPAIQCSDEQTIVSVVTIEQRGDTKTIRSDGSVEIRIEKSNSRTLYPMTENGTTIDAEAAKSITIAIDESDYAGEWEQWFDGQDEWAWSEARGGYECTTDAVFVRETTVTVRLFS